MKIESEKPNVYHFITHKNLLMFGFFLVPEPIAPNGFDIGIPCCGCAVPNIFFGGEPFFTVLNEPNGFVGCEGGDNLCSGGLYCGLILLLL